MKVKKQTRTTSKGNWICGSCGKNNQNKNPVLRQEIVKAIMLHRIGQWTAGRARAGRKLGRPPGAEGSIGKLMGSNVARQANKVHTLLAGAKGMLSETNDRFEFIKPKFSKSFIIQLAKKILWPILCWIGLSRSYLNWARRKNRS